MNTRKLKGEIVSVFGTQAKFAVVIGWHKNKVSKMICNKYKPDTDEVAKIVEVLDLSESKYTEIFLPQKSPNGDKTNHLHI